MVLALPRGGVPVGFEVATTLDAPLDVYVVRKVGAPGSPEFGIGAVTEDGGVVTDEVAMRRLGIAWRDWEALVAAEAREVARRVEHYRGTRPLPRLAGAGVILVDDGLATGVTAEAALRSLRAAAPGSLVLAVPVCAPDTVRRLRALADDVVCLAEPPEFLAVGQWYEDFDQTSDDEVRSLLADAASRRGAPRPTPPTS